MVELREENVKQFRLEDGTYVAAQYEKPVHYLDENNMWQNIDNTLADSGTEIATSNASKMPRNFLLIVSLLTKKINKNLIHALKCCTYTQ